MSALRVFQLRSTVCVLCVAAFVFAIKNKSATLDEGRALVVYRYMFGVMILPTPSRESVRV